MWELETLAERHALAQPPDRPVRLVLAVGREVWAAAGDGVEVWGRPGA